MNFINIFNEWLDSGSAVRKVADDMHITSELILLVRVIFADGLMRPEEINCLKEICKQEFEIREKDLPQVLEYLKDIGYETSMSNAAAMFKDLDMERKKLLLVRMYDIAKSDYEIVSEEIDVIRRTAEVLGVNANNILAKAA